MIFKWAEGSRYSEKSNPVTPVAEHLTALRDKKGSLTALVVLQGARVKRSPLHTLFEWDDNVAAHEYRLVQAREVLRSVVILNEEQPDAEPIRAFVTIIGEQGTDFTPLMVAMNDEQMRAQVIARALREMQIWTKRYGQYEELAAIVQATERLSA